MVTIKGPLKIKSGEKLPDKLADVIKKQFGIVENKPEKTRSEAKKVVYTRKALEKMDYNKLKEIGYKLRVRGRSKKGLIEDILAVQAGKKKPEF